jgi:integrase
LQRLVWVGPLKHNSVLRSLWRWLAALFLGPLFADVAIEVLADKQLKAEETRKAATRQISRLVLNFGALRIRRIREPHWIEYVVRERAKRERTFFDDRKYMRLVLGHAARTGRLVRIIELSIPEDAGDAGRELEASELAALREAAAVETADGQGRGADDNGKSPDLLFQIDIAWKMGLRLREMLRLRWDQVNLERGTVRLKAKDRKNRRALEIPINPDLLPEFLARRRRAACQWVFPSRTGAGPIRNNKTAWRRCKREAGVNCRWHDFRHHCATVMLRGGVPRHVVKSYLGNSEQVLDKIYAHLNLRDMRQAALVTTDAVQAATIEDLRAATRLLCLTGGERQMG